MIENARSRSMPNDSIESCTNGVSYEFGEINCADGSAENKYGIQDKATVKVECKNNQWRITVESSTWGTRSTTQSNDSGGSGNLDDGDTFSIQFTIEDDLKKADCRIDDGKPCGQNRNKPPDVGAWTAMEG